MKKTQFLLVLFAMSLLLAGYPGQAAGSGYPQPSQTALSAQALNASPNSEPLEKYSHILSSNLLSSLKKASRFPDIASLQARYPDITPKEQIAAFQLSEITVRTSGTGQAGELALSLAYENDKGQAVLVQYLPEAPKTISGERVIAFSKTPLLYQTYCNALTSSNKISEVNYTAGDRYVSVLFGSPVFVKSGGLLSRLNGNNPMSTNEMGQFIQKLQESGFPLPVGACPSCNHGQLVDQGATFGAWELINEKLCRHGGNPGYNDLTKVRTGVQTTSCSNCGYKAETPLEQEVGYCPCKNSYC